FIVAGFVSTAQAQVKLVHKFPEGSKTKVQVNSKVHQILTINGSDVETTAEEVVVSSTATGARKADGTLPIEQKIESMRLQITLPMNVVVSFDSAAPAPKKDDNPVASLVVGICQALVGTSYSITLDKDNHFVSVEGIQKVLDKADDQGV